MDQDSECEGAFLRGKGESPDCTWALRLNVKAFETDHSRNLGGGTREGLAPEDQWLMRAWSLVR